MINTPNFVLFVSFVVKNIFTANPEGALFEIAPAFSAHLLGTIKPRKPTLIRL